ncbi:MAG: hypothetical protein RLZZ244_2244 [Verrucomicrobiota bacterium]|jgi:hypothetical protein
MNPKSSTAFIHGDEALASELNIPVSTVRSLRSQRLIPCVKAGHRTILYSLPKVLAALSKIEIQEVTK